MNLAYTKSGLGMKIKEGLNGLNGLNKKAKAWKGIWDSKRHSESVTREQIREDAFVKKRPILGGPWT